MSLAAALIARQFPQWQNLQLRQQKRVWFNAEAAGQQQKHPRCFRPGELCGDHGASWGVKMRVCVCTTLAGLQQRFRCFFVNRKALGLLSLPSLLPPLKTAQTLPLLFLQHSCCLSDQRKRKGKISYHQSHFPPKTGNRNNRLAFEMCLTCLRPCTLTGSPSACTNLCSYMSSSVLPVPVLGTTWSIFLPFPFKPFSSTVTPIPNAGLLQKLCGWSPLTCVIFTAGTFTCQHMLFGFLE